MVWEVELTSYLYPSRLTSNDRKGKRYLLLGRKKTWNGRCILRHDGRECGRVKEASAS